MAISGLLGCERKASRTPSSPMSWRASGKCALNQSSARSGAEGGSRLNSAVGANRVHVKDLSYGAASSVRGVNSEGGGRDRDVTSQGKTIEKFTKRGGAGGKRASSKRRNRRRRRHVRDGRCRRCRFNRMSMTMTGPDRSGLSLKFDICARRFALNAFGCIEIEHSFGVSIKVAQRRKG